MSLIEKYKEELSINGRAENSIETIGYVLNDAKKFKNLKLWNKQDVNKYILSLKERNKPATVELKKVLIRSFFEWSGKGDIVSHLKSKKVKNILKREDLLTIDEINLLIETTASPRYKALIAFLFESGARISEALAVKVSDIQETDKGMIISVPQTKTDNQPRRALFLFSAQYIRNLITYSTLSKDDLLFPITRDGAQKAFIKIGKKAGIKKNVSPHKFRHAQATEMVLRGYQETLIRKKLGWSPTSDMIARYQNIIDDDVIDATFEKAGNLPVSAIKRPEITEAKEFNLIDASTRLMQISDENEELKTRISLMEELLDNQKTDMVSLIEDVISKREYDNEPENLFDKYETEQERALEEAIHTHETEQEEAEEAKKLKSK